MSEPFICGFGAAFFYFDLVIFCWLELKHQLGKHLVFLAGLDVGCTNNKRRARFIYQKVVNLIHDREILLSLHGLVKVDGHVVSQIIETKLR